MKHVRLGRTGLHVSRLCLGTMTFGLQCDEERSRAILVVRAGKVRYVGVSNYLAYQLARAIGRSETLNLVRFDSAQPRHSLLFREVERELFPLCQEEGVGVIPYNPLAGGLLSGKHDRTKPPADGSRFTLG
ncbi:aldo/keto reductase, partial [Frankia sp. CpI1-P]